MLKVEHTEVMNFEGALRGARNPLKSWDKSDSFKCDGVGCYFEKCPRYGETIEGCEHEGEYIIGQNDMQLARTLVRAGSSHRKFIRQIFVSVDITAPFYWWKQFDQYKIGVVTNSESTMHCIHAKPFTLNDFSFEHLEDYYLEHLKETIRLLNEARNECCKAKKEKNPLISDKDYWWQMIQLLPNSYNQKRTVTFDYENLRNMYHERKNHKLDEWHTFCEWVESLPYSELITMEGR